MAQATVYSSSGQQQNPQGQPPPVKKPRSYPYNRDAQSRAAQYYDLYEMIRHPHLARDNRPPDPPPAPKYGSKQQQIEAGLERKFIHSSKTGILIALIKGFVYLGFLPFYLLFIALPSWIYSTIAHYLMKLKVAIQRKIEAVKQFFIRQYHKVVDPFKKLWKRMRDRENNKQSLDLGDDDLGFFAFIALGVYYAYSGLVRPTLKGIRAAYRGAVLALRWIKARPQKAREAFDKKWEPVRRFKKKLAAYPGQLFKKLKAKFLAAAISPLLLKFQTYQKRTKAAFNRLGQAIEGVATAIKDTLLTPVQTYHRLKNWVIASIQRKIDGVKALIRNYVKRPIAYLKAAYAKLESSILALKASIPQLAKIKFKLPFVDRLKAWKKGLKNPFEPILTKLKVLRAKYFSFTIPKVNLTPRHLDNLMKAALYKLFTQFVAWLVPKVVPIKAKFSAALQSVIRPYRVFEERLEMLLQKLNQKIQRFLRPIRRFAHRRILRLRLFIGWVRVVARHSLNSLREGRY